MRVYKATYKDRSGKKRKSAKWYLDLFDHDQLRHKIPAFADKRLSEALDRNIEALVNCRIGTATRYVFTVCETATFHSLPIARHAKNSDFGRC